MVINRKKYFKHLVASEFSNKHEKALRKLEMIRKRTLKNDQKQIQLQIQIYEKETLEHINIVKNLLQNEKLIQNTILFKKVMLYYKDILYNDLKIALYYGLKLRYRKYSFRYVELLNKLINGINDYIYGYIDIKTLINNIV
jgi:hypothetical protein